MVRAGKPKILVTRPQPGAEQTAARLAASGIEPIILPLTEMVKLAHQHEDLDFSSANAIIVTSANAVRHVDISLLNSIKQLPVFAVGDATREAALAQGMSDVISADGNARDLFEIVSERLKPNASIIYLCGKTRTDQVEKSFEKLNVDLHIIETYETNKVSQLTYKMNAVMEGHTLDGVLLYSGISAQIYSDIWEYCCKEKPSTIPICFCISERARSALCPILREHSIVCAHPRDDVMIEAVHSYFSAQI